MSSTATRARRRPFTTTWDQSPLGRVVTHYTDKGLKELSAETGYSVVLLRAVMLGNRDITLRLLLRLQDAIGGSSSDWLTAAREALKMKAGK